MEEAKVGGENVTEKKPPIPTMNFAEYVLSMKSELAAALKCFANVRSVLEEKPRVEWDKLLTELKNRRI